MTDSLFPLNSRVALRMDSEGVYTFAIGGSHAYVRDQRIDTDGFPLVLIEWDRDHWRFNGQPDGWTFASHFELIEGAKESEKKDDKYLKGLEDQEGPASPLSAPPAEKVDPEKFLEELHMALEEAVDSDGFLILTVKKTINPLNPKEVMFVPAIHSYYLSDEAGLMLDAQLAQCAAASYQEMVYRLVEFMAAYKEEGEDAE